MKGNHERPGRCSRLLLPTRIVAIQHCIVILRKNQTSFDATSPGYFFFITPRETFTSTQRRSQNLHARKHALIQIMANNVL